MPWRVKGVSKWQFQTSGTGGLGLAFVVGSGGEIVLKSPTGPITSFHYGAVGVGLSFGLKRVPKIGRFDSRSLSEKGGAAVAPEDFPNHGLIYVLYGCNDADLSTQDFKGVCIFYDAGVGLIAGYAAEVMLMNCNPGALAAMASGLPGVIVGEELLNPHAMLVSWGPNLGLQANAGISGSVGYLR